ncbi:Cytochrome c-type biogenesis protein CcmH precursor [Legionella massiliensis]|uniref:Cytochrome c-type biogenesis protein CcmH n=1 Tax=Legionella massiliensis TaxID=1034943 RepID=A0A078L133_9GAMM|nr:tetratricopeptide repeat protein [Legionella massiliensis]CDZ78922.1 Cytochrome c-type biogenesis protein CcmH precursor [Legionella massiliensis]CEE14660.1 Cytochrome c-type biogenesis protein CcmH precursor [Legionella massiliensis]
MNEWWLIVVFIFLGLLALTLALYPLRRSKLLICLLSPILIIALSIAYWRWGSWVDWQRYVHDQANKQQIEAVLQTIKSPAELIDRMKARLTQDPKSVRGWYLLGRLYASQGQWTEAGDAFYTAYQLKPEDAQIAVNYAQSLVQLNQEKFNESIRDLLKKVLEREPNQPDAMAMLAMDAYSSANYPQAIAYWQQLLKIAPARSEEAQMLRKAIAKAQQQLAN